MDTNETIEINDLALTKDQQAAVKGGIIVLQDCLVSSYQSGGSESGAKPGGGALQNLGEVNTWTS